MMAHTHTHTHIQCTRVFCTTTRAAFPTFIVHSSIFCAGKQPSETQKHFFLYRRTQCDTGALQNGDRAPDKSGRSGAKLRADAPSLSPIYCGDFYSNLEDLTREERVEKNPAASLVAE